MNGVLLDKSRTPLHVLDRSHHTSFLLCSDSNLRPLSLTHTHARTRTTPTLMSHLSISLSICALPFMVQLWKDGTSGYGQDGGIAAFKAPHEHD